MYCRAILGVAFSFGMALMVTAWGFGRISGAHFNPAITLASLVAGTCTIPKAIMYFFCQLLGACLGVAMARGTTPSSEHIGQINYLVLRKIFWRYIPLRSMHTCTT